MFLSPVCLRLPQNVCLGLSRSVSVCLSVSRRALFQSVYASPSLSESDLSQSAIMLLKPVCLSLPQNVCLGLFQTVSICLGVSQPVSICLSLARFHSVRLWSCHSVSVHIGLS